MMNGNTAIAYRKYEVAVERLKLVARQLATAAGRDDALAKISIGLPRSFDGAGSPGLCAVVEALGGAIKADIPKYIDGVIRNAQDEVRGAQEVLRSCLDDDLKSTFMGTKSK